MAGPTLKFIHASDFHLEPLRCARARCRDAAGLAWRSRLVDAPCPRGRASRVSMPSRCSRAGRFCACWPATSCGRHRPAREDWCCWSNNWSGSARIRFRSIGRPVAPTPPRAGPTSCICRPTSIWPPAGVWNIGSSSARRTFAGRDHGRRHCRRAAPESSRPISGRPPRAARSSALSHGRLAAPVAAAQGVHYWALGGSHRRRIERAAVPVVHYPGAPQGRTPAEAGPRTAVHVGPGRRHP